MFGWTGPNEDFEGAAFDFFGLRGVDEVACGQDDGARRENGGLPVVGKAQVNGWGGHGAAL